MNQHPTPFDLQGLIRGDLPDHSCWQVIVHLAGGCRECVIELTIQMRLLFELEEECEVEELPVHAAKVYDEVIDRVFLSVQPHIRFACEETLHAREALVLLENEGSAGFVNALENFPGLAGYWALLDRLRALRFDNPKEMIRLAHLAVLIAEQLSSEWFGDDVLCDLRCRAAIELSNAYRVADDLVEAERVLGEAAELYESGRKDPLLGARLFDVQASLLGACRQFGAASAALDAVRKTYLEYGDSHLAGRALIKKALYVSYSGDPEESLHLGGQGLELLDPERDPSLVLLALHNQAFFLVECGRYREARMLLWQASARYRGSMGKIQHLKFRWIEGRANVGLNELDRAEQILAEVRKGFDAAGLRYKSALVTLELAMIALRRGQASEARGLVLAAEGAFKALRIQREVLAAVLLLEKAFETDTATLGLLEEMYKFLTKAEADPNLILKTWLSDARQA